MEKICTKCKARKSLAYFYRDRRTKDERRSWCKKCDNARTIKYRKANIDLCRSWERTYPIKKKAKSCILTAIRSGRIVRGKKCEACGNKEKLNAHHDDYSKTLDIRWLCVPCHQEWHTKHGQGLNG